MLTYAFQSLRQTNYQQIAAEQFDNIQNMFAAILFKGVSQQIKQGLNRQYIDVHENLSVKRGKIDFCGTVGNIVRRKQVLLCEHDVLSENNLFNQILKTTIETLIHDSTVSKVYKNELKQISRFFYTVDLIAPSAIGWNKLSFRKNNKQYELLLNICRFILFGYLQTTEKGEYKMKSFLEDSMPTLFERFIREYYRYHHKYLDEIGSEEVKWGIDTNAANLGTEYLPRMKTDVTLHRGENILIIDAKYYGKIMQDYYDTSKLNSSHLYQIQAYVKNMAHFRKENISGLLLYAQTNEKIIPDASFYLGSNKISVKALNLNADFSHIAHQLDLIAEEHFGSSSRFHV